ncbi:MAG: carbonic anhydrase family protein [Saprospiraceae bacterium]|nr:carbonic anhydrase family protein [Saprospiraceae bacterium]
MNGKHPFFRLSANLLFATLIAFLFACNGKDEAIESEPIVTDIPETYDIDDFTGEVTLRTDCEGTNIHWEYEGIAGPDHWDDICETWDCDGNRQSPVNIVPPLNRTLSKLLRFFWKNTSTNIVNNGHTIQYNIDQPADPNAGSFIWLNGQKYYLLQFHFHAASEHTVNGEHYPVEIHFVHRNPTTGQLAVVGVLVEEGDENPFFEHIGDQWPHDEGNYTNTSTYNPNVLMPAGYNNSSTAHFWWYDGSLTTPPCSEIVNWMVWSSTIEASHEQLEEMEAILHENYRPVLPLGARLVKAQ